MRPRQRLAKLLTPPYLRSRHSPQRFRTVSALSSKPSEPTIQKPSSKRAALWRPSPFGESDNSSSCSAIIPKLKRLSTAPSTSKTHPPRTLTSAPPTWLQNDPAIASPKPAKSSCRIHKIRPHGEFKARLGKSKATLSTPTLP